MDLYAFDTEQPQFLDQAIEVGERLHLLLLIDQKKTGAGVFLQQHNPFTGVGRVADHVGIEHHPSSVLGPYVFALHKCGRKIKYHPNYRTLQRSNSCKNPFKTMTYFNSAICKRFVGMEAGIIKVSS